MYNDTVIGLGVILLFLAGAGLLNFYEKRKGRRLFLEKMMASWGKIPQREYSYEELDHISQFFRQREKEGIRLSTSRKKKLWNRRNFLKKPRKKKLFPTL